MLLSTILSAVLSALLTAELDAQPSTPLAPGSPSAESTTPPWKAHLLVADGTKSVGIITQWSANAITQDAQRLPLTDIVHVQFPPTAAARGRRTAEVLLANGDRLAARVLTVGEESLTAEWTVSGFHQKLKIPLETVTGFTTGLPGSEAKRLSLFKQLQEPSQAEADCLFLENSDTVTGELTGFDGRRYLVRIPATSSETSINSAGVGAVRLNPGLISFPETTGVRLLATLIDGSRVTAQAIESAIPRAATANPELIQMHLTCGTRMRVPRSALKSVAVLGGRAVYLSDLKPVAYRFRPFLSQDWPLRHDRNVVGGPLRLRGQEYAKGLGTHSRSEIRFALDRKYERFSTVIGIDDCSAGGGQAVFSVFVDGQRVYHSGMVSGNDAPRKVPTIDVSNSNRLTLSVDYGAGGDVLDRADWCQALLIRKSQPPR